MKNYHEDCVLRLCRPMCGKALPFRFPDYFFTEAMPHESCARRSLGVSKDCPTEGPSPSAHQAAKPQRSSLPFCSELHDKVIAMWKFANPIKHSIPDTRWPTAAAAVRSLLFQPIKIGSLELESRTWAPAMVPWRATEEGFVTQANLDDAGRPVVRPACGCRVHCMVTAAGKNIAKN